VPQLPVGTYRVLLDNNQATLEVRPEAAEPVELTGLTPHTPRSPALIAVVVAAVILIVVLLRSSRFLLALVLAVATVVTSSVLVPSPTRPNGTWETCLSIMEGTPRERDLARRNCKVRTLLEMLGPRAENREEVESFLENNTDSICHEVAHLAGFYFSRVTPDPATASRAMMKGCNDGMAHGVLEALSLFNDDDEFLRVTNDMCAGFSDLQMQRTCAHGLGHATVWRTNGNLESAAEICMRTTDTRTYGMTFMFGRPTLPLTDGTFSSQAECISAATMEWADRWEFERREGATRTLIPELEEPMDACIREGLPETFYVGCYLGTSYRNRDTVEAAKRCNFVAPYPVSCFAALGDNLSLFTEANLGRELSPAIVVEFSSACLLANDRDAAEACSAAVAYRHMLDIKDVGYMTDLCADFDTILLQDCMRGTALARDVLLSRGYPVG
jgi:hypothetical protein